MAEDLEEAMRKFSLTKLEEDGAVIESTDFSPRVKECENSLIGKIIGSKVVNFTGVKIYVRQAWGHPKGLIVTKIAENMFQFIFSLSRDKEKVIENRPWVFDNQLLALENWSVGIEENEAAWDLPLHWVSKAVGLRIAKAFKAVHNIVIPQGGGKSGKHIKLLVDMDVIEPIPKGLKLTSNESTKWINFKYERIADFCYKCGMLGHSEKNCKLRARSIQQGEEQYGPWLRATGGRVTGNVINGDMLNVGGSKQASPISAKTNLQKDTSGGRVVEQTSGVDDRKQLVEDPGKNDVTGSSRKGKEGLIVGKQRGKTPTFKLF